MSEATAAAAEAAGAVLQSNKSSMRAGGVGVPQAVHPGVPNHQSKAERSVQPNQTNCTCTIRVAIDCFTDLMFRPMVTGVTNRLYAI